MRRYASRENDTAGMQRAILRDHASARHVICVTVGILTGEFAGTLKTIKLVPRYTSLQARLKLLAGLLLVWPASASAQTGAASPEFFESKVRPILATNCYACHANSQLAGLRIDSRAAMLKGGQTGPSIVPGDPDKSLLIQAVRQTGELKMPKGGKLKKEEVEALVEWVRAGAVWPEAPPVAAAKSGTYVIRPEHRAFWSFQPIHDPPVPAVRDASWPKTEIDRF